MLRNGLVGLGEGHLANNLARATHLRHILLAATHQQLAHLLLDVLSSRTVNVQLAVLQHSCGHQDGAVQHERVLQVDAERLVTAAPQVGQERAFYRLARDQFNQA